MSNMIYACWRESRDTPDQEWMTRIADRITPEPIRGRSHRILGGPGECLCVTGPHGATAVAGVSARVGVFSGEWPEWSRPGSQVPEGSFALIRSHGETTELCSDFSGTRTLWYVVTEDTFFASTSQRALVCLLQDLSFNRAAFAWFLSSGTLGPSDSWDHRIQRLPGGARLVLDRARWTTHVYAAPVVFRARKMNETHARKTLHELLWKAIQGCDFQSAHWIFPLSGGYDSRILLAALYETGLRPRTVTWGLAASRTQWGNDAWVAPQLAEHYGLVNDYLLTEHSEASPASVVDAFLSAHGGTTDALFPYLDGLKLWSRFAEEGVDGIIRGDEGFGTDALPELQQRFAQGFLLLRDFLDEETAGLISDGRQAIPADLKRHPGESEQAYGDRLHHAFFIPTHLAALNDVKAPFVEVANPMLSGTVLEFVRQMPDRLRAGRGTYERLTESVTPAIPFATLAADDSRNGFLHCRAYATWIAEELESDFVRRTLPDTFRERLLAAARGGSAPLLHARGVRATLKRIMPASWVVALRSWRTPDPPADRLLAFRCALASRLARMLGEDAEVLGTSATVPGARPSRTLPPWLRGHCSCLLALFSDWESLSTWLGSSLMAG